MIDTKEIPFIQGNYSVGDVIKCNKPTNGDRWTPTKARIIGKYPWFALVTDDKSRWCVQWADFLIQGITK